MTSQEEVIQSIDVAGAEVVTDVKTYSIMYPKSIRYEVGDTVPQYEYIDKVCDLLMTPPYVTVRLKKEYGYLRKIFTFDSNKILELID